MKKLAFHHIRHVLDDVRCTTARPGAVLRGLQLHRHGQHRGPDHRGEQLPVRVSGGIGEHQPAEFDGGDGEHPEGG